MTSRRRAARPDPRRWLRGRRRRARAEEGRRRRRAGRQARLPHLPAAPLPGGHRPARAVGGRASAARPVPRRSRTPASTVDDVTGDRPGKREVQFAEMEPLTYDYLVLGARRRGQLLRSARRSRARVPDVHARRRRAPQGARPGEVGGRRQGRLARRGRCAQHRRRRRRPDRAWRAPARSPSSTDSNFAEDYPDLPAGAGADHARRGLAPSSSACSRRSSATTPRRRWRSAASRSCSARSSSPSSRRGSRSSPGRCSRRTRSSGAPVCRRTRSRALARARAAAGQPHRRRAGSQHRGPSRGVRRRRHRLDHRHEDRRGAAAARLGRAPGRRARRREHRPARRRQGDGALPLPRQGHDGDDRPRRRGRSAGARTDDEGRGRRGSPGARSTSRCSRPARIGPRRIIDWTWSGFTHERAARISIDA